MSNSCTKLLDNGEASVDLGAQKDKSRRKPLPSTYEPGEHHLLQLITRRARSSIPKINGRPLG